jgi:hypothetical protein
MGMLTGILVLSVTTVVAGVQVLLPIGEQTMGCGLLNVHSE